MKKDHERMDNLDKCFSLVQQSSAKGGISAIEIGKKLDKHRSTVHKYLTSLQLMGKIESHDGKWFAKTGEQTIKPLEKEIIIELPLPKSDWQRMVLLEDTARMFGEIDDPDNIFKISLDKLKETRTIRITGKNVDDLDLKKVTALIEQANQNSLKASLKGVFRGLKRSGSKGHKQSSET